MFTDNFVPQNEAELLSSAVMAMHALTEGNPDILDSAGVSLMAELMNQYKQDTNSGVMEALVSSYKNKTSANFSCNLL